MTETRDGAYLAHISDTVEANANQLGTIVEILRVMVDTQGAQSEMLAQILGAAIAPPGPSPVAEALRALAERVDANTAAIGEMAAVMEGLPAAIGEAIEPDRASPGPVAE
ncbi:hypothetical protein FHR90_003080 [Endobacter medicaginis]|uniref:Uncharacterized protein n=1 Tax=Endobacter medicaginis TaxID=1181271 RepID=A0A839UZL5_9PROT|nr:hypothetical protein [Endobacter medicaginis]MBB3175226.1 hypothetical protein [Endobacter medicaginis]MCX5476290.1 hypothetical protein [Endobacter medicaginis]NVN28987.1 hypothetical protein [Endobacter medicaginis]